MTEQDFKMITNLPCFKWLSFSDGIIPAPWFGFLLVIAVARCRGGRVLLRFLTNLDELASFVRVGVSQSALCLTHVGGLQFYLKLHRKAC